MKKIFLSVVIGLISPILGSSQNHFGTELYMNLNVYYFEDASFIAKFFQKDLEYEAISKSYSENLKKQDHSNIQVYSINKELDTIRFLNKNGVFFQGLFNREDRVFILIDKLSIEIPAIFIERISMFSNINIYSNFKKIQNKDDCIMFSYIRLGDVIKPKMNFIYKKGKQKLIKETAINSLKQPKLIFELENKFTGSN